VRGIWKKANNKINEQQKGNQKGLKENARVEKKGNLLEK